VTIQDAIKMIDQIKADWPGGYNFKNKSKFLGFCLGDIRLSVEDLESLEWGVEFESHDKEWNAEMTELRKNL
jgi:hypothetical protein